MVWGAPRGVQDLVERVRRNDPSLQSLCLMRGRRFEEGDALELCEALGANTILRELSISSHAVGPAAAAAFARMLTVNTTLTSLDLGNSAFGDEGLAALAPGIAASASLRQLNLERKGISAAGLASLAAALSAAGGEGGSGRARGSNGGSGRLEELLLGQNSLGADGLAALLDGGVGSSTGGSAGHGWLGLRSLDLTDCGLQGAEGVQPLAAALQQGQLPCLAALRLDRNELGAAGIAALAPALHGSCGDSSSSEAQGSGLCAKLAQLHLQRCQLGREALVSLAAALPASLAVLDLSGNAGVGSQGAGALAEALEAGAAPRLRKLLLCGCGLDDASIARLADALALRPAAGGAATASVAAAADSDARVASEVEAGLALDLSGNSAGAAALAALASAPLSSLCLHDCKLGGREGGAPDAAATAAAVEQLAAPGAFRRLRELDVSGNRLQAEQLVALLAALTVTGSSCGGGGTVEEPVTDGAALPCPRLQLLVIAANPGAADDEVLQAVERLQEARPGVDVVRRAADTGEGGLVN